MATLEWHHKQGYRQQQQERKGRSMTLFSCHDDALTHSLVRCSSSHFQRRQQVFFSYFVFSPDLSWCFIICVLLFSFCLSSFITFFSAAFLLIRQLSRKMSSSFFYFSFTSLALLSPVIQTKETAKTPRAFISRSVESIFSLLKVFLMVIYPVLACTLQTDILTTNEGKQKMKRQSEEIHPSLQTTKKKKNKK